MGKWIQMPQLELLANEERLFDKTIDNTWLTGPKYTDVNI